MSDYTVNAAPITSGQRKHVKHILKVSTKNNGTFKHIPNIYKYIVCYNINEAWKKTGQPTSIFDSEIKHEALKQPKKKTDICLLNLGIARSALKDMHLKASICNLNHKRTIKRLKH